MSERYKCYACKLVVDAEFVVDGKCPECGSEVKEMCEKDHCHCSHEISETVAFCSDCGEAMCPECECHDVAQISRVTGYLQEVNGWNAGKRQELKDRTHYTI